MAERGEQASESWWRRRGQKVLRVAVVLQITGVVAFIGLLLVAERSHVSFVSLYLPRHPLLGATLAGLLAAFVLRRRALVAIQAALCLVVLVPVMGLRVTLAGSPGPAEHAVRLATYNVFFGKGGRAALVDELAAMPVDILVLQATYDSLPDRLRERLPDRTIRQDGELVIVTRFPIVDVEVPPTLPGDLKPMFVGYVLQTPDGPLRVLVTHPFSPRNALLDHDEPWEANVARREAQVAAVVAASRRPGPPFVIAGDTNLPVLSAIARRELGDLDDAFESAGSGLGYTFPAKRPWMRIDRAFAGRGLRFTSATVGPRGASDHRPLFVVIERVGGG
jgi:vancomycin resistance protein VanJ